MSQRNYLLPLMAAFVLVVSSACLALIWISILDPEFDGLEHKIDLTALNQLNLIIGFLYVNLIQTSLNKWRKTTKLLNNFAIDAATLVIYDNSFENIVRTLKEQLKDLLSSRQNLWGIMCGCGVDDSQQLQQLSVLTQSTIRLIKKSSDKDNIIKQLASSIKNSVESMDRDYFEKDPSLFHIHLNILLFLYFGSIPVQLYNSYGFYCLVIYPIMIYLLFSVVLWANAFHSPLDHPELQPRFQLLQRRFEGIFSVSDNRVFYKVNNKGQWSFKI